LDFVVETVYVYDNAGLQTTTVDYVAVYNDYESYANELTGEYEVFYIQYLDDVGPTPELKTVLLNNSPAYTLATFSDINMLTMRIKPWRKVFTVEETNGVFYFTLPRPHTFFAKSLDSSKLRLYKSQTDDKTRPWFVRISNGTFRHNLAGDMNTYSIAEFPYQAFNPMASFKKMIDEPIARIESGLDDAQVATLVKLNHTPIGLDDLPADIVIKDQDGVILYALTTDPTKHGTVYSGSILRDSTKILSWDKNSGIVQVDVVLRDYYGIFATYYYTEEFYEYTSANLNPLTNRDVLDHTYVIYAVPVSAYNQTEGQLEGQTASIYHLKVGRDGYIVECSQDATYGAPDISAAVVGTMYGRPDIPVGSFLNEYTLEAPPGEAGQSRRYLVLGEVAVAQTSSHKDVVLIDARQRGGGLKDDYREAAKLLNPEVIWYGDGAYADGIPYPAKSVVIVKLPYTLLSKYGGRFEENEVRAIVEKHMAFGSYPVIRYYGAIPNVYLKEDSLSIDSAIRIYWSAEPVTYTYNIYMSLSEDGDFVQLNVAPIPGSTTENSYLVSGLIPRVAYYFRVAAIVGGVEGMPSKTLIAASQADGTTLHGLGHMFIVP